MDEDSQQEPESPRMAPPTTPSPAPSTPTPTPQPIVVVQPAIPTTTALTVTLPATQSAVVLPVIKTEILIPGSTLTSTTTTATTTITTPTAPVVVVPVQQPTTPNQSQPSFLTSPISTPNIPTTQPGLLTPISLTTNQNVTPQLNSLTPLTGAGGSITAGISNQMVTQQNIIPGSNSLLSGGSGTASVTDLSQQMTNNGIISTPTRGDPQSKVKSGVLRFGPAPTESEMNRMPGEFYFFLI